MSEWIEHHGDVCPVAPETLVKLKFADGSVLGEYFVHATSAVWSRVTHYQVKESPAPAVQEEVGEGDIVQRLRDGKRYAPQHWTVMVEAANVIERLRNQLSAQSQKAGGEDEWQQRMQEKMQHAAEHDAQQARPRLSIPRLGIQEVATPSGDTGLEVVARVVQKRGSDGVFVQHLAKVSPGTEFVTKQSAEQALAAKEAELETERLRLAACGVAALGYFTDCKPEYRSASLEDVLRLQASITAAKEAGIREGMGDDELDMLQMRALQPSLADHL